MLRKIVYLIALFLICAIGVDATSIEKNPNKRKGAGAPFQIRRYKKWGYMDKAGKVIIEPQFDAEGDFFHGLARVLKDKKWGYIDKSGKWTIQPGFTYGGVFSDGLARVYPVNGTIMGYIDKTGKMVIHPQYEEAWDFSEERD